jgi:hypothetical protein
MHLPGSIELLKKRFERERIQEIVRQVSTTTTQPSKLNDVEYYEDYEETSQATSEKPEPQVVKAEPKLPRQYSIDLWNGSPILPHFENFKNDKNST